VFDGDAWQHAYELIAPDASDHVVGAQASSQGVGDGDEQRVPRGMTSGVVRDFEPVHVDVSSYELSADALGSIDLPHDGSQPGAAAAHSCQLIGPGVFTILGSLRAIFRCNLAVVAALCAIVRCNLAVVDGPYAAVRGISAFRGGAGSSILRALTVARRAIPCSSIGLTGCVVTRFGLSVTQPCRDVTVPRGQPSLATAHGRQLVSPGILAVLRRLCAIVRRNFAVVDGSHAAIRGIGAPRVGSSAFVCRALTVAGRAVPCTSVAITGRVVTRLGLSVTQPRRDVAVPRSEPGLPTAYRRQLVRPGILAVLRRLGAIVCCNFAVVNGSFAAVRGISAARVGPGALVCRAPAIARRAIPGGPVELTGRVVTRFGFSVTLLGGEVTRPRSEPRSLAILCRLRAIFGCKSAVVDGLGTVIRSFSSPRGGLSTFICRAPAIARGTISFSSVKITRCVITSFGLSVTQPGRDIPVLRSQPRDPTARACQLVDPGIFAILGGLGTIFGRHLAVLDGLGAVVRSPSAPRGGLVTFVCRMLPVGRRAISCGSVKIAGRVIARLGFSVAQPGRDVTVLRSKAGLPAAHSCQLVGPGIFAILGGLGAILGRNLAVIDSLGAVIRGLGATPWRSGTFACRPFTLTRRAIPCGSVEVSRRVITRFRLSVTLLRLSVTHVRSQIAVAPF